MAGKPLWTPEPDDLKTAPITAFMHAASQRGRAAIDGFDALHAWSVSDPAAFWDLVWDHSGVIGEKGARILTGGDLMPGASFFPDARLNFAENLLRQTGGGDALVFRGEDKAARAMSFDELRALVSRLQQAMRAAGVGTGDRVAAMMPNMPEAIAAMLAAASLGAIWSSCSPDFGERGVLDRFGQIEPKLFIACDGYWYNGKQIEVADKLRAIAEKLISAEAVVVVPYLGEAEIVAANVPRAVSLDAFLAPFAAAELVFERLPFGLKAGDKLFYFTTCGWMMWNWLASGLASGATLLLYDGSPFYPDGNVLFDYAQAEGMTVFGTSAKFIDAVRKADLRPRDSHDLAALAMMTSTGSPLAPENFDFVYDAIKPDVHLASISGGTDIVACFVLGAPGKPVWKGEIQGPGLGMAVDVWDDAGHPIRGEKGELVCTKPFPSMPVRFWNDPDGGKYHSPISTASTMSGAMAILPNGQTMAASSSTAAPTQRSIPAAYASERRKSTTRSNRCRRLPKPWRSARTGTMTSVSSCSSGWRMASA
jgi:acetoacetyl-CoA synthetase